jgi:hypothetical protein
MIINDYDTLMYSALDAPHNTYMVDQDEIITGYEIGIGFTLNASHVFGLP